MDATFEDEFEEFRARSYSGGFSMRRRRRPHQSQAPHHHHHRSRTTDRLSSESSADTAVVQGGDAAIARNITDLLHFSSIYPRCPFNRNETTGTSSVIYPSAHQQQQQQQQLGTNVKPPNSGLPYRLLEVVVTTTTTKRDEDSNGNWNLGAMRPRLNSAPHSPRRAGVGVGALGGGLQRRYGIDLGGSVRHRGEALSYPMRKIRSFIVLGKRCINGEDDVIEHVAAATNFQSRMAAEEDFRHHLRASPQSDFRSASENNFRLNAVVVQRNAPDRNRPEVKPAIDERHLVLITGKRGVGKSTIMDRFLNKDSIGRKMDFFSSDKDEDDVFGCCPRLKNTLVRMGGDEVKITMSDLTSGPEAEDCSTTLNETTTIAMVVYSVEDRRSYDMAVDQLYDLRRDEAGSQTAVILVANKVDLVRTRIIAEQEGKSTAKTYNCRYIEVSATIDHQIDDLFLMILRLISIDQQQRTSDSPLWCSSSSASVRQQRWKDDGDESFDHRQNSDSCCLLAAREKVLSRLFHGQRRASRSCTNLFELSA